MNRLELRAEKFAKMAPGTPDTNVADVSDILRNFVFGDLFHHGSLSDRQREMITLTNTATLQIFSELRIHVAIAGRVGLSPDEIYECVAQCPPYIGFPKTLAAQACVRDGFADCGIPVPTASQKTVDEESRCVKGAELEELLFGDEIKKAALPDHIKSYISKVCIGEFLTRSCIDLQTRLMLALCSVTAIGGSCELIKLFIRANIKAGNTREKLEDAITHSTAYIGFPLACRTFELIADVCSEG